MTAARYLAGQSLLLRKDLRSAKGQAEGLYTVVRVMPEDSGEPCYRIKHDLEAFERIVTESQLADPERNANESA
jgi:hypothetical protein